MRTRAPAKTVRLEGFPYFGPTAQLAVMFPSEPTACERMRRALSTLLFHALRRDELCKLKVRDFRHARRGVPHLRVSGKGEKTRYLPLHPGTNTLIHDYLEAAGHGADDNGALFRPVRNNRTRRLEKALTPDAVYKLVRRYSAALGFEIGAHALRATAATNALVHHADIAKVQDWLGHANIATTRIYDHRKTRPEDSPTYKVFYLKGAGRCRAIQGAASGADDAETRAGRSPCSAARWRCSDDLHRS